MDTHLSITHVMSSPYHMESQGALKRFHQTMKSMFKANCYDTQCDWDDRIPIEIPEYHIVHGLLKVIKYRLLSDSTTQLPAKCGNPCAWTPGALVSSSQMCVQKSKHFAKQK